MGISGIGAAEYQMAGYRAGKNGETGTKNFMETVAEKSVQDKVTEYGEKAFDLVGAKAPQSVKDAWMETVEEVRVNGLGMTSNGSTHITQLHIQQVIANYWGLDCKNILGSSVQSAMQAAQKALYDFEHPLEPEKVRSMEEQRARTKEREFYTVFLDKLKNLAGQNQRNEAVNISGGISFTEHVATKAAIQSYVLERSFKDMWQTKFPGAYYHTMDACQISQGIWERLDFPHDEFFRNKVDESILDWKPTGPEPKMTDSSVQSRAVSTLGKKSIVVPPALEEKMKDDPTLAKQVMERVETFIAEKEATKRPNRIRSYILVLDEDGEIAHTCITSGGGASGPTEAAQRQFEAEQEAKRRRRAEYMGIVEESALKRKLMGQEANEQYDKASIAKEKVSAVYEKNNIETVAEKSVQDKVTGCGEKDGEQIWRMSETDFEERVLQSAGPNAPQSVKDAWMETVKEVGVNGLGETKNGRTHITQMYIQQAIANYYGLLYSNDILGNSVESAIRATQKALYDFDHPLEPGKVRSMEEQQARMKEREFYTVFLEKLKRL